jgi:hypothetical protein
MPYKSLKQERYFNANRAKMEAQGVDVDEWNSASKGMKLPVRVKSSLPKAYHAADSRRGIKPSHGKMGDENGY